MKTVVRINDRELTTMFQSYVERRVRFALGRFAGRVGEITVRVSGSRRQDYRCRINAEVLPFGQVSAEEIGPDLYVAMDRAAGRIGRSFGRALERTHDARILRDSIREAA